MRFQLKALRALLLIGVFYSGPAHSMQESERPNILLILLDDVGYGDLGAYGSEIETPNIDALAADGLTFNNFHATPTCSPTRASLLTGRDPHRVGMGLIARYDFGPAFPAFRGRISDQSATLAQILQDEGISTYAIGKWHLAPRKDSQPAGPFTHWPLGKGFNRFYGFMTGSTDQFAPELVRDNQVISETYPEGYNLTVDLVDHAIEMAHNHVSYTPDRPFFMYLATPGMHAPHQAPQSLLIEQRGRYDRGWDVVRTERFQRQKDLGLVPQSSRLPATDARVKPWETLDTTQQQVYARLQETYAGFLTQTDEEIGRLLSELEVLGVLDNTIVIVLSDNGGSQEGSPGGSINHTTNNNGIFETADDILRRLDEIGGPNTLPNYPLGWAQVSNTPFPYFKQHAAGGGISVPFIVNGLNEKWGAKGGIREQYHFVSDVMPTVLDLLGIEIPDRVDGKQQLPVDGQSMTYAFAEAEAPDARKTQFYRMAHNRGIYDHGWMATAVHKRGTKYTDDVWSLFNLEEDFTHATDLANTYPEKLARMKEVWRREGEQVNAALMVDLENPGPKIKEEMKKRAAKNPKKHEFIYYPRASHVTDFATPDFIDRSFSITASIDRPTGSENGVLFANGNHDSGLVLYIHKGRAVYEYNYFANVKSVGTMYKVTSDTKVPRGASQISLRFDKTGKLMGTATLLINGEVAGTLEMPKTMAARISHEGMDIGRDANTAVGSQYNSPYEFEGKIENVTIRLGNR